ncbi:LacI family DNA-binding transcriptional regulator [Bacillus timonensis]|uniref:LacI family DNA-binding transcriptional regulator n=1 Tax=Bacillus timonensis TaxID=1033734 RepID=UPI000288AECE|nr:LacI family DNA-binding transcriptional regulator [Bacillus timonensis]
MIEISVTLRDIVDASGVSLATVSRVLSGKTNLSSKKAIKVIEVAKKLGYELPKEMVARRSMTFGVVASKNVEQSTSNAFFSEVIKGIANFCNTKDINIQLIIETQEELELLRCAKLVENGDIDGFILLASRVDDQLINYLSLNDFPFIVIGHVNKDSVYTVNTDGKKAFEQLTNHLIMLGHKTIGLINSSIKFVGSLDALAGYRETLQKNNIEFDETLIYDGGLSWEESYETALQILSNRNVPTALVVSDDIMAAAAIKAIREQGLKVPGDVAIVSYSDHYLASLMNPGLTTIRVPIIDLGFTAAKSLYQIMNKEEVEKNIILETKLVIRDSCGFKKGAKV